MLTSEQIAEGWIEHDGGPCPVPRDTEVEVLRDNGLVSQNAAYGLEWRWKPRIIAYRPEPTP